MKCCRCRCHFQEPDGVGSSLAILLWLLEKHLLGTCLEVLLSLLTQFIPCKMSRYCVTCYGYFIGKNHIKKGNEGLLASNLGMDSHGHSGGHHHGVDMDHPILVVSMIIISISVKEGY
ncbi:hypothetical protein IFM89_021122 [Coptis chinensis]|uniref:Uncharacterized protein n=1 Tax=Coptis chinensis TaxID=261450 RepID=A0A835H1Z0_9MAGN|nr:hypothetical protein IFM89_021122 [Coptis chinensis]